jgi:hypothetical protein
MLLIADISRDQLRLSPGSPYPLRGRFGVLVFAEIRDHDVGPFAGERDGNGSAYAGIATGDQDGAILEPATSAVAFFSVIGSGLEGRCLTRGRLLLLREGRFGTG